MRKLLAVLALAALVPFVFADDEKPKAKELKKLAVGDPAPALKVDKWLQGEVKAFKKDHVYVVEFWATWCPPCITMMPHVAELQEQYKKDVTIIGFSSKDDRGNNEKGVTALVKKRGPKLKYTFAYSDDRDTNDAYLKASGQTSIPCCVVVDKESKVAYIGHPMYLDVVLPKVVKGKWDAKKSEEEMKTVKDDVNAMFKTLGNKDAEAGMEKLAAFDKKYPEFSKIPFALTGRLSLMVRAKKTDDVKKFATKLVESATKYDDVNALQSVSGALRSPAAKDEKELLALSLKAAETLLKVSGEKDMIALFHVADSHHANGNKAKAIEFGKKAVEASNPRFKEFLEGRLKEYEGKKKDE